MIAIKPILLSTLLLLPSFYAIADDYAPNPVTTESDMSGGNLEKLVTYLRNLGTDLGYDLEVSVTPVDGLLDNTYSLASTGQQILKVLFGAVPVTASDVYDTLKNFTEDNYADLNTEANATFTDYAKPDGSAVTVTKNVDQETYQKDPVSQFILNTVGTPDDSVCNTENASTCVTQYIVMNKVLQDVIEDKRLPGETNYYSYDLNKRFISQLNSNTLLAPLVYSEKSAGQTSGGGKGLPVQNQLQQAQDFILYATSSVVPFPTIQQSDYYKLAALANTSEKELSGASAKTLSKVLDAQTTLSTYLLNLRVYAAQNSVAVSNLYSILAKRIPQEITSGDTSSKTSQALTEFQMATWRMYNPEKKESGEQWVDQISKASPARVGKEIAVLLSEINYQLYLNRQQEERILLTNSLQLLQSLAQNKPNPTPVSTSGEAEDENTTE